METHYVIAVNATALTIGGGLTILKQFIDHIKNAHHYYIFISNQVTLNDSHYPNVTFIRVPPKSFIQRILWDSYGWKQWFKQKNIVPQVVVSLQNTSMASGHSKQVIYLHQGLCLHPKKWSFLKKSERLLAMYRYIYPFFIFMHANHKTHFVVQTEWMKNALCERFKRKEGFVHVIKPNIKRINVEEIETITLKTKFSLFYPANGCLYKNQAVLLDALYALKQTGYDMSNIALYLTMEPQRHLVAQVNRLKLHEQVHFLGVLTTEEMLQYYKSCTMVVFPSYIESFGLPLLEATIFNKPIVVAEESYAKEVLAGYPFAYYAMAHSNIAWKEAIIHVLSQDCPGYSKDNIPQYKSSWRDFFQLIHQIT